MRTHKHITDHYERDIVLFAIEKSREMDFSQFELPIVSFPVSDRMYVTFDKDINKVVEIEYREFLNMPLKYIRINK